MKRLLLAAFAIIAFLTPSCMQQQMQQIAYNSKVVVLDIGHYFEPTRGGQGARTPDATKGGMIEETEFSGTATPVRSRKRLRKPVTAAVSATAGMSPTTLNWLLQQRKLAFTMLRVPFPPLSIAPRITRAALPWGC